MTDNERSARTEFTREFCKEVEVPEANMICDECAEKEIVAQERDKKLLTTTMNNIASGIKASTCSTTTLTRSAWSTAARCCAFGTTPAKAPISSRRVGTT